MKRNTLINNERQTTHHHHPFKHRPTTTTTTTTTLRILFLLVLAMLHPFPTLAQENGIDGQTTQTQTQTKSIPVQTTNANDGSVESLFHQMDTNHDVSLSLHEFTSNFSLLRSSTTTTTPSTPKISKDFWNGFTTSTTMIIATEIGDKTFFIAAVLSMRNSRYSVFFGSVMALVCMTILSTLMGLILPSILPKSYTHIIGGLLFFYFGIKLMYDSRSMENKVSDELGEVEEELLSSNKKEDTTNDNGGGSGEGGMVGSGSSSGMLEEDIESNTTTSGTTANSRSATPTISNSTNDIYNINTQTPTSTTSSSTSPTKKKQNNPSSLKSWTKSILFQAYLLTFLAEWGDRSQIATIALAADRDPYGVTFGACFGHALCTGMAVVGGRILASKISEKTVSFWGGVVFLGFGFHSLFLDG